MQPLFSVNTENIVFRFVVVVALILMLMIPLLLVRLVVDDRVHYYFEAVKSVADSWSGPQYVAGPFISVPIVSDPDDDDDPYESHLNLLPSTLNVVTTVEHEIRERGIFGVVVLTSSIKMTGYFDAINQIELEDRYGRLNWSHASVVVGVTDPRGIRDASITWNGEQAEFQSGSRLRSALGGIHAPILAPEQGMRIPFELTLQLRGIDQFSVVPVGDETSVAMNSTWPHPSFIGSFLPDSHDVSEQGFQADWTINSLARGFTSEMTSDITALFAMPTGITGRIVTEEDIVRMPKSFVGFSVYEPVTPYRMVFRTMKYGAMFIVLTMVGVLCIELASGLRLHYVQYGVVGIALVVFYLTLLALTEHIGFTLGYAAAATILTVLISGYTWSACRSMLVTSCTTGMLVLLYGSLYALLQLDEYSLLLGTGLLLFVLGVLMWTTRNLRRESETPEPNGD